MKNKTLLITFIVLLVLYLLSQLWSGGKVERSFNPILFQLDTAAVTSMDLYTRADSFELVKFEKNGSAWSAQKGNITIAVEGERVNGLLDQLQQAKAQRIAAKKADRWSTFEVEEANAKAHLIVKEGSKTVADVWVGGFRFDPQTRTGTSFLRKSEADDVYALDGFISMGLSQGFDSYRDKSLLRLTPANLTQIQLELDDQSFTYRNNNGQWTTQDGASLDSTKMASYLSGLASFNGTNFADNFSENQTNIQSKQSLTFTGNNMTEPIRLDCYTLADAPQPFVVRSSLNPAYFSGDSTSLYQRLFKKTAPPTITYVLMTNKEIARTFNDLARIMELHDENPFKIRSYANAYLQLRKVGTPLVEMSDADISGIKGVGKAIAGKIREMEETGTLAALEKYKEITPEGVQKMLKIKGFGPKKIKTLWKGLEVETIGELLYACNENRLVELKGFGEKTQEDLRQKLEYFLKSQDQFLFATLEEIGEDLLAYLQQQLPEDTPISFTGAFRRRDPILKGIEFVVAGDLSLVFDEEHLILIGQEGDKFIAKTADEIPVRLFQCEPTAFGSKLFRYTGEETFTKYFLEKATEKDFRGLHTEADVFAKAGIPFIAPELREGHKAVDRALAGQLPDLIEANQVKGVLHAHSTYSDGINTLREMAEYARDRGYEYLGITDHSKSAFYANGLKEDRLRKQWAEIDALNSELAPFKIYKGIESDILNDGSLDYPADLLQGFDFIIASVHSNLRMDKIKATKRLLAAIANPYTTMLGHPTGRLLLAREGYPIDHQAVIDACAEHRVAIEINANPLRLDLDYTWIDYALEKGVLLSVNPDAHSTGGIHDIHYGVLAARKGGLSADRCVCCLIEKPLNRFYRGSMFKFALTTH